MKFGVLTFGYDSFPKFGELLNTQGYYDANLGDNAQSIAIRNIYRHFGIRVDQMIDINRDALPQYDGPPAILIMNGVFYRHSFPMPKTVVPIFVGFHAAEPTIRDQLDLLRANQPIGCRDEGTTQLLRSMGIEAFTTGCLTLTLPCRKETPSIEKLLIVYGSVAGRLPPAVLKHVPEHMLQNVDFIYHRFHASKFPFDADMRGEAEHYEEALFERYRREATLILTPLHHVATPCMAFGIPVIICRERNDVRFTTLEKMLPIYTPEKFGLIDWSPAPIDINTIRAELFRTVGAKIVAALANV